MNITTNPSSNGLPNPATKNIANLLGILLDLRNMKPLFPAGPFSGRLRERIANRSASLTHDFSAGLPGSSHL